MTTNFKFNNGGTITDFDDVFIKKELFSSDGLWLWGYNNYGQLGNNVTTDRSSPVQTISSGTNWKQVSCGRGHTAAIKTDGSLWLCGRNLNSQLGDNTTTSRSSPVQTVSVGTNWKLVACGLYHTAAIKTDGSLWLWGLADYGQLGNNAITNRSSPVQTIAVGTNWNQVTCGDRYTAAIKTDGTLWLWGDNANGQLGMNLNSERRSSPVQTVAGGTNWKQVACNYLHTAAIKTDGSLWLWGQSHYGQLGDNTTLSRSSPVQTISGGTNWKQVDCGDGHTTAIKTDGTLWLWGYNFNGQLGIGVNSPNISAPVQTVSVGTNWKLVACGALHTAAIKNSY